jgi:hypothetical protein
MRKLEREAIKCPEELEALIKWSAGEVYGPKLWKVIVKKWARLVYDPGLDHKVCTIEKA